MKKHLLIKALLVFVVLLTSSAQAWGWYTIWYANVYYDDSNSQWGSNVRFAIEKGDGGSLWAMTPITNTKLFNYQGSWGDSDVRYFRFAKTSETSSWYGWWYEADWKRVQNTEQWAQTNSWDAYAGGSAESINNETKMYAAQSNSNDATLDRWMISNFPDDMNHTQNVYYAVCEGAGSYSKLTSGKTPAKLEMSSYKFESGSYTSVSSVSPTALAAGGTTLSRNFSAAHTATTNITVSNIVDGYEFMGWYDAASGGSQLADASQTTLTYYPRSDVDVYARFRKTTYSIAGENWTADDINWAAGTVASGGTKLLTSTDGITYSVSLAGETTGGSLRAFKLIKNQAWDGNAIAANTEGVTSSCINGTLGNSGNPNYNFTLTPYLSGTITISYNSSTKVLSVSCEAPTITFSKDGGQDGTSTQKTYSTMVTSSIETPSKTGYNFAGYWSDDATPIQVINSSGAWIANKSGYTDNSNPCKWTVNANHTFTAHWTEILHDVAVEAGDHGSVSTDEVKDIGIATESGNIGATADEGYHFVNWTLPTGVTAAAGYSATSNPIHINATADGKTITANFEANEYTITLDDRSATTAVSPSSVKATYDANTLSSSITNPAKTGGYTFAGWYLEYETGSGIGTSQLINTSGALNASVSPYTNGSRNWVNDGGVTVYARWKANANVDKFNFQYGSGTYYGSGWTVANFGDATNNKRTVDFTMPDPSSKKCYVGWGGDFIASGLGSGSGWSSEINLTDVRLEPCTSATVGTATGAVGKLVIFDNNSSANLYIGFEPSGYAVGTADRNIALTAGADNFYYTDVVTISSTEAAGNFQVKLATSSSYTTCGHGTAENASTVSGRKITGDADIANSSKGVFQMWNNSNTNNFGLRFVTVYDMEFNLQGHGDAIDDYTDVRYNDKISAPTDPTEDGYVFHGWFKEAGCVNEWNFATDVVTTGTTLFAKWTSNIGTIDKASGTTDGVYRVSSGATKMNVTTPPVKSGYHVNGYFLSYSLGEYGLGIADGDGNLIASATDGVNTYTNSNNEWTYTGDAPTIYARWAVDTYDVTLDKNTPAGTTGSAGTTELEATYDAILPTTGLVKPSAVGYTFAGYFDDPDDGEGVMVITASGVKNLESGTPYIDGDGYWKYANDVTLYAHWTINNHDIDYNAPTVGGSYTIKAGDASAVSADVADVNFGTTITLAATPATGYTFGSWNVTGATVADASSATTTFTMPDNDVTVEVTFTAVPLTFKSDAATSSWNTASNWNPACVPTIQHDVTIEKPVTVDIAHATAKSVVIYNNGNTKTGKLTIQANKGLEVTGTVRKTTDGSAYSATTAADLVLESSSSGNASLVFNNSNSCAATVEMYSPATISTNWNWQFMGTPFTSANALYSYYGAYLYEWKSTGAWDAVANGGTMTPFTGYCITQDAATTYTMDGTLNSNDDVEIDIPASLEFVMANSWSAPICVCNFTETTLPLDNKTIYLYNTGFTPDPENPAAEGTGAGTYVAMPINSAVYTGNYLIAPMEGFYVDNTSGSAATITLKYDELVRPSGGHTDIVAGPMHAPRRVQAAEGEPTVLKIKATGSRYSERIVILAREDFSTGFDNGWDGKNLNEPGVAPILYALRADGTKDAVSAIPNYEGTVVGFRKGEDSQYTFSFDYDGAEMLYLNDLKQQTSTLIDAEHSYTFTTAADDAEARFIISASPIAKTPTGIEGTEYRGRNTEVRKLMIDGNLYIIRGGRIYDATGALVK